VRGGVLVPAFLAAGIVGVRAVLGDKRAPYPYEYLSWLVVYGGIGMIPDDQAAQALAWAYLAAMLLAPSFANVIGLLSSSRIGGGAGTGASASASASSSTRPARTPTVSPHTGTTGG
jgi:hypothetical protein